MMPTSAKASFSDQAVIFQRKHNWIMCWLYLGTFGSFLGFAAAFPLLTKTLFPDVNALQLAFLVNMESIPVFSLKNPQFFKKNPCPSTPPA